MGGFKLSPQQRQLWRLQRDVPAVYSAQCAVLIEGDLRGELLAQALASAVRRSEILRTTFVHPPGLALPLQVVVPELEPAIALLADGPGSTTDEAPRIDELLMLAGDPCGDLESGPVLRAAICKHAPERHILTLALPALCADSAGIWNLVEEAIGCYRAALRGGEPEGQPVQYPDIAEVLNDFVDGNEAEVGRAYWRGRRAPEARGEGAEMDAGSGGFAPELVAQPMAPELAAGLADLAGRLGIPVSVLLLAAWQALSCRLGDDEALIGVCCAGRSHPSLETALGLLARFLPVVVPTDRSMIWSDLAQRTSAAVAEVTEWQDSYAGELRKKSWFARCFEYEERPEPHMAGDLRLALAWRQVCFDRFDLKLVCVRQGEALWSEWRYDSSRFERLEVERLAERFLTVLGDVLVSPHRSLGDLALLGEAERLQLASWNGPQRGFARERLLPRWIAEQAESHPESPAVECEGRRLSYGELDERANRVARRLLSLGVKAESRVALCAPRSPELVVGMLGILKAGAAYVPLDPAYPIDRLSYMLEDSGAELVLALRRANRLPPASPAGRVLWLDEDEEWAPAGAVAPELALDPAQLAYLIYTSGSTGRPKGVAVSHANLLHSTVARWEGYGDRVEGFLVVSSVSFDSSVAGLFWTLSQGGMVCLPGEGGQRDALALAERIGAGGISHLLCLPSLYTVLLDTADRLRGLRVAIVAGESCPSELPQRHRQRLSGTRFYNEYGPTEATVWSTVWEATADVAPTPVPIGRTIVNASVWLLDDRWQPAPAGMAGEISVGGGGVVRGYINRPELTAERFIPDGLSGEAGARLYLTGDRGRWSRDGELTFLGRADRQVKLRGHRIELGEIESVLRSHAEVGEAVVVLRDEGGQNPRLVGYWSPRGGLSAVSATPVDGLREWLRQKLPEHMVPSALVALDEWPRTPNGKLDERGLPAPETGSAGAGRAGGAARRGIEELIAAVWGDVLGREQEPGRDASFFDLGGHSLSATQVVSRLRAAFQVDLTLPMLFETPTVAGLAARIEQMHPDSTAVPPLAARDRPDPLPLSYAQQRLWFLDQMHPGNPFYNVSATVRLRGVLVAPVLARALRGVIERHEALRTRFPLRDGQPVQEIAAEPEAVVEEVDLSSWPETQREDAARNHMAILAEHPFDLARGPLLRTMLIRLSAEEHLLLLTMHHIISDGWSMGVLVRELTALYAGFLESRPSPLAPLPIQYADFACWQRGWLQGEVLETQLDYWRRQLDGAPAVLELPTDHPRPAQQRFRGETRRRILSPGLRASITGLARREGATLFMALATAFDILLHDYVGRDDIVIGTNVANRNREETEGLVGFFLNQLVLRTDLGGDPSFVDLLARVRATALGAYAHQDLSFDMLVAAIHPERSTSRSPLYQVLFTLHNAPISPIELPGLTVTPVESPLGTAKFDLSMALEETDQGLLESIEYDVDLFEGETIERMLAEYEVVVAYVVAHPEDRLSKIEGALAAARLEHLRARSRDLRTVSSEKLKLARRRQAVV